MKLVSAGITGVWGISVNNLILYRGYTEATFTVVSGRNEFLKNKLESNDRRRM